MRGFFILGVTFWYSAAFNPQQDLRVVSSKRLTLSNNDTAYVNVLFGQAQQAVFTTKVVHAYFIKNQNAARGLT